MIVKSDFDGQFINENGVATDVNAFCVVICENVEEWKALRTAFRLYLRQKESTIGVSFERAEPIIRKMYKETL